MGLRAEKGAAAPRLSMARYAGYLPRARGPIPLRSTAIDSLTPLPAGDIPFGKQMGQIKGVRKMNGLLRRVYWTVVDLKRWVLNENQGCVSYVTPIPEHDHVYDENGTCMWQFATAGPNPRWETCGDQEPGYACWEATQLDPEATWREIDRKDANDELLADEERMGVKLYLRKLGAEREERLAF